MAKRIENFGEYVTKKIKTFNGMEGQGFNATLYRGNFLVADLIDDASGGEVNIHWRMAGESAILDAFCKTLPAIVTDFKELPALEVDAQLFVSELVNYNLHLKDVAKMKKQCQTKTLFRTKDDGYGAYRTLSAPYDHRSKLYIQAKYGDNVEIFNEVLAAGKVPSVLDLA